MRAEKLTKRVVDAALPPVASGGDDKPRERLVWDRDLKGFGLQVMPSGLKSFFIQYRNAERRSRRAVIGRYGLMTVEEARKLAHEKLVAVAKGADPVAERAQQARQMSVAEVCDWYLKEAEAGRILGRKRKPIKASTLKMDASRIERHIKPLIGTRRVRALSLRDVEGMQADIAQGKTAKARGRNRGGATMGGGGVAARTVSTLHSLFEHALRLGVVDSNPARGVRKLAAAPRERRLNAAEIQKLGNAARDALLHGEHPTGIAATRFLLLTGFRRQEALGLKASWVDRDQHCVRLPDTKSGPQVRVIGQAAMAEIQSRPMHRNSTYVFPADWGDGHFTAVAMTLRRLCSAASLNDVSPHVLRHTFASMAGELGFSELTIAALLGHAARGVTQRYVHIDEAVRMAADRVSMEIARLLDG
jgi:integrase